MNWSIQDTCRHASAVFFSLVILALAPAVAVSQIDRSDLNSDGMVDSLDLEKFAELYLGQDWEAVNWCTFYESTTGNERYFRKLTSDRSAHYAALLGFIVQSYDCHGYSKGTSTVTAVSTSTVSGHQTNKSDLNDDGVVDLDDLVIFSTNYLEQNWETVDWCLFHGSTLAGVDFEGSSTKYYLKHFGLLLDFINDHFNCGGPPPPPPGLVLENVPNNPYRLAAAGDGSSDYYVTDPGIGSMFVYDEFMVLKAEIKGLNSPLGIAVDSLGRILIGNDGRDNIEVYDPATGDLVAEFAQGLVRTPNAITFDAAGNIYVTDSRSHHVKVFDPSYNLVRTIGTAGEGEAELNYPTDAILLVGGSGTLEIFVADQGNNRVQVFDLNGKWLDSITYAGQCGMMGCTVPGFQRVQAVDVDSLGQLHVLDRFGAAVNIFNPANGAHLGYYGGYGTGTGMLQVPNDVLITTTDMAIVTAGDGDRIEVFTP